MRSLLYFPPISPFASELVSGRQYDKFKRDEYEELSLHCCYFSDLEIFLYRILKLKYIYFATKQMTVELLEIYKLVDIWPSMIVNEQLLTSIQPLQVLMEKTEYSLKTQNITFKEVQNNVYKAHHLIMELYTKPSGIYANLFEFYFEEFFSVVGPFWIPIMIPILKYFGKFKMYHLKSLFYFNQHINEIDNLSTKTIKTSYLSS